MANPLNSAAALAAVDDYLEASLNPKSTKKGRAAPPNALSQVKKRTPRAGVNHTICLNMIVKNERKTLERLLPTVLPLIDAYIILDTGSTDGTQEFIRSWMRSKGVPGEVHQGTWEYFGPSRQRFGFDSTELEGCCVHVSLLGVFNWPELAQVVISS